MVELCERLAFYTFTSTQELFLEHLGYSLAQAGGINAAMGMLCMAWAILAGWLADSANELRYYVKGIEDACKTTPVGVANACGIHIHADTICEDATAVGGHYSDVTGITADPWTPISYIAGNHTSAHGSFDAEIEKEQSILGRAMIVHDSARVRVACTLSDTSVSTSEQQLDDYSMHNNGCNDGLVDYEFTNPGPLPLSPHTRTLPVTCN